MDDAGRFTLSDAPGGGPVRPRTAVLLLAGLTVAAAVLVFVMVGWLGVAGQPVPAGLRFGNDAAGPGGDVFVIDAPSPAPPLDHFLVEGPDCMLQDRTGADKTEGGLEEGDAWVCRNDGPFVLRWYDGTELYRVTLI